VGGRDVYGSGRVVADACNLVWFCVCVFVFLFSAFCFSMPLRASGALLVCGELSLVEGCFFAACCEALILGFFDTTFPA